MRQRLKCAVCNAQLPDGWLGDGHGCPECGTFDGFEENFLTDRELSVLSGAAHGETSQETAKRMNYSVDTIKSYKKSLRKKLRAKNTAHAVWIGITRRLI